MVGEKLQEVEKNNYMRWWKLEKRIKMKYKTDTVTGIRLKRFMKMIWTCLFFNGLWILFDDYVQQSYHYDTKYSSNCSVDPGHVESGSSVTVHPASN